MQENIALKLTKRLLRPATERVFIRNRVYPELELRTGLKNLRILHPAERIHIADPDQDAFVPVGKYYKNGWYDRPNIFVYEVPHAYHHVESGLTCTRDFKAVLDFGYDDRICHYLAFGGRRPLLAKRLRGLYSSVKTCFSDNFGHWMHDCLPKVHSLARTAPRTGLTLLMPASANEFQRETLRCVLPDNFKIEYVSGHEWVHAEQFLWPSMVSGRCMYMLPPEYYEPIRGPIFKKLGLPKQHAKTERLYISRQGGKRCVINEDAVMRFLEKFGFRKIVVEELSFRQQVELFHRAEIVVGAHGAGINTICFSGDIDVVVLYSTQVPPNYFHTQAVGLGQKHHFVCHDEEHEDSSFAADLPALERVFREELGLKA